MIIRDPSDVTPTLNLPFILPSQAQKHVTVNESLSLIDGLVQMSLKEINISQAPELPQNGDAYMISSDPIGDWASFAGRIALWSEGQWFYVKPQNGWTAWIEPLNGLHVFEDGEWAPLAIKERSSQSAPDENGRLTSKLIPGLSIISQLTACPLAATATQSQESGAYIPSHHLLIGVRAVVSAALSDGVQWSLGDGVTANKFATSMDAAVGVEALAFCDPPRVYWEDTPIRVTTNEDNTRGALNITVYSLAFTPSE